MGFDELVFGVSRARLDRELGVFQGFRAVSEPLAAVAERLERWGEFRERDAVERDPSWLQLIPYVALTSAAKVLLLERLPTQGEARLHRLRSIGVGGHVNPEPPGADPLIVRGLRREIAEEIQLGGEVTPELLGFIRDDSDDVGKVHFGIACRLELARPVEVREKDRMIGRWVPLEEAAEPADRLESWSRILIPAVRAAIREGASPSAALPGIAISGHVRSGPAATSRYSPDRLTARERPE